MRSKKIVAGIIAAMTLASLASSAIVSAAGFGVGISNTKVEAGDSFTLTLDMSDIPSTGINGCDFGISYDSSLVSVSGVTLGDIAKSVDASETGLPSPFECNIETDVISVMYALGTTDSAYYLNGSGTFLNITGTVKATAAVGSKAEFKIVPVDRAVAPGSKESNTSIIFGYMAEDETTTIYSPTFTDGYVEVTGGETKPSETEDIPDGTLYGDVNNDTDVNIADIVKLNMYLLNKTLNPISEIGKANADCVRDNVINTADSTLIMNYVAMMIDISQLGKR